MGRYSLEDIEAHIASCLAFLAAVRCDAYTRAFWLCSLWAYLAAKKAGTGVVNSNTTQSIYNDAVYAYRNRYAHNDSMEELLSSLAYLVDRVTDDMMAYSEIDSSVRELRNYVNTVGGTL